MTNPNNAIGTNGAFDGRTSPNALNDIASLLSAGIVTGWACEPKTGMTVQLGGDATTRDVALAEDNAGNKLTINNRSGAPVDVTLEGAPATNNRIDAIVAYVDNPSTGDGSTTDNPTACGIIAVKGTVAANPVPPTDAQIRSAITTDGATGGVAYYVILATVRVGTNVTTIGAGVITPGDYARIYGINIADGTITAGKILDGTITANKLNWSTFGIANYSTTEVDTGATWIDGKKIYKKTIDFGAMPNNTNKQVNHNISNLDRIIRVEQSIDNGGAGFLEISSGNATNNTFNLYGTATAISVTTTDNRSGCYAYFTLYYTKTS